MIAFLRLLIVQMTETHTLHQSIHRSVVCNQLVPPSLLLSKSSNLTKSRGRRDNQTTDDFFVSLDDEHNTQLTLTTVGRAFLLCRFALHWILLSAILHTKPLSFDGTCNFQSCLKKHESTPLY